MARYASPAALLRRSEAALWRSQPRGSQNRRFVVEFAGSSLGGRADWSSAIIDPAVDPGMRCRLGAAEVERLVREAEENAESDKTKRETVETRNAADSAVFQAEKILKDDGDKIPDDIKSDVESKVKEVIADDAAETSLIASVTEELQTALQSVGQAGYAANEAAGDPSEPGDDNDGDASAGDDEDTVEGEFREV